MKSDVLQKLPPQERNEILQEANQAALRVARVMDQYGSTVSNRVSDFAAEEVIKLILKTRYNYPQRSRRSRRSAR